MDPRGPKTTRGTMLLQHNLSSKCGKQVDVSSFGFANSQVRQCRKSRKIEAKQSRTKNSVQYEPSDPFYLFCLFFPCTHDSPVPALTKPNGKFEMTFAGWAAFIQFWNTNLSKMPLPPPKKRQRCGEDPKQSFLRSTNSGTFPFVLVFYHTPINRLPFFTHPPVQHVQLTRLFLFFLLFFRLWTIRLALEMKSPWKNGASLREFPNHSHPNHLGSVTLLLGLEDLACAAFHRCNFEKICWEILKIITPNCDVCVLSAIEFALRQGSIDVRCCWFTILGTFPGTLAFLCMQVSCNNLHLAV